MTVRFRGAAVSTKLVKPANRRRGRLLDGRAEARADRDSGCRPQDMNTMVQQATVDLQQLLVHRAR